ncbi:MAG: tyrosine-type recombinase/integrase, partial [Longimicrobiales bacterium]
MIAATFPALLQRFFTDRLLQQRQASPHTIAGYRDTFRLLLRFAAERLGRAPSVLTVDDLTPAFIAEFLDHLQRARGNSIRTRNARLAAIHSFAQYVAVNEPAHALHCQRLLALPSQRYERKLVAFLTPAEIDALLASPDPSTWIGCRDRTLLLVAIQTGLRVSELIGLTRVDVVLGPGAHVQCVGKGRKHRGTPLRREAVTALEQWLRRHAGVPGDWIFPSVRGGPLSRDAVERLVARYASAAATRCPSLTRKRVTPHVLRHSTAMNLLRHGVDRAVIALWLGHESVETTQMYLHADLQL